MKAAQQPRAGRRPRRPPGARARARRAAAAHRAAALDEPHDHAAPQGRVLVGPARRRQGGEERVRRHGERRRARGDRGRAAHLPDRARRAARRRSSRRSPRRCAPRTTRELGNRVSAMFASLPVEIDEPGRPASRPSRARRPAGSRCTRRSAPTTLEDWADVAAPALFSRAIRALRPAAAGRAACGPSINLVVSNVPGPPFPLYLAGARLVALHPLGPDLRRLRAQRHGDLVPRPRRLRVHRVPRAGPRRRRPRRRDPRRARASS